MQRRWIHGLWIVRKQLSICLVTQPLSQTQPRESKMYQLVVDEAQRFWLLLFIKSAPIRFGISHISIFGEAQECSAGDPEGNFCIRCGSGSEMTWSPPNEGGFLLSALRCFLLHSLQCLFSVLPIWKLGYRDDTILFIYLNNHLVS